MNKKITFLLIILIFNSITAREIRTPLPTYSYPIDHRLETQAGEHEWAFETFATGYSRKATKALCKTNDTNREKKCSLSQLIFCKSDFQAQETFTGAQAFSREHPFLNTILSPRFEYSDKGLIAGFTAQRYLNENWSFGMRGKLPFRKFSVKLKRSTSSSGSGVLGGETINDVAATKTETFNNTSVETYAYRLDFLTALPMNCTPDGLNFSLVEYNDTNFNPARITIRGIDITETPPIVNDKNAVTTIKQTDGPPSSFGILSNTAQALPALSNNGTSIQDNERAQFISANNYTDLSNNTATQKGLWIVPSIANEQLVAHAQDIRNAVNEYSSSGCISTSAENMFERCGLSFDCASDGGIGDLDTEFFAQYSSCQKSYLEFLLGIRVPTADRIKESDAGKIFLQPLGNNGHTEIKFGLAGNWMPCDYFVLRADSSYSRVLSGREFVPAAFPGATIKNIGPIVPADIKWGYYLGHVETHATYMWRDKHDVYLLLGYELYHKEKDDICYNVVNIRDCIDAEQKVDARVLEKNTDVTAHKIYLQASYAYLKDEDYAIGIYGGASWVIGGNNTPREHDWYLGIRVQF